MAGLSPLVLLVLESLGRWRVAALAAATLACGAPPAPATTPVSRGDVVATVTIAGRVEAARRASLIAPFPGPVDALHVSNGQRVRRGDALLDMSRRQLEDERRKKTSALVAAQTRHANHQLQLTKLTSDLGRTERLKASGTVSDGDVERIAQELAAVRNELRATKTDLDIADIDLRQIEQRLAEATLRAPFDGIVTSLWVPRDQFVAGTPVVEAQMLLTVSGDGDLTIKASVSERDVSKFYPGQVVAVTLPALPGFQGRGHVEQVDDAATVNDKTGAASFRVLLKFVADDGKVKSGMEAHARAVLEEQRSVLKAPRWAFTRRGERWVTMKKQDDEFREVAVQLGLIGDVDVHVVSGLAEGDILRAQPRS